MKGVNKIEIRWSRAFASRDAEVDLKFISRETTKMHNFWPSL